MKIVIIKTGALGDVLRTTFLPPLLKKKYHPVEIAWVTKKEAVPLLKNNPMIDKVIPIEKIEGQTERFSLILSLDDDYSCAEIASKLQKEKVIGAYIDGDLVRYTADSSPWFGMGILRPEEEGGIQEADRIKKDNKESYYALIAKVVGVQHTGQKPILNLTDEEIRYAKNLLKDENIQDKKIIGINTGSGNRWKSKRWSVANTSALIDGLQERGYRCIVLGGPEEQNRNKDITDRCRTDPLNMGTDHTLRQFAAIIAYLDIIVTTDTLALHIATALDKKIVALIGPTSAAEIDLFGKGIKLVPEKECCFYRKECPHKPSCMDTITPEVVRKKVEELV
jgi:heptosyltransferase-2